MPARILLALLVVIAVCAFAASIRIGDAEPRDGVAGVAGQRVERAIDSLELERPDAGSPHEARPSEPARTPAVPAAPPSRPEHSRERMRAAAAAREPIRVPFCVRVVDELGAPVAGARVQAELDRTDGSKRRTRWTRVDALGVATLEADGAVGAKLSAIAAEDDRLHDEARATVERLDAPAVLVMATRHWVTLTIVDRERRPVTAIQPAQLGEGLAVRRVRDQDFESATGVYAIEVGRDADRLEVRSIRDGRGAYDFDPSRPSTMTGRLVLERASTIEAFTRRSGSPVTGVRVALVTRSPRSSAIEQALYRSYFPTEHCVGEQRSDAQGRVQFAVDEPRDYVLVAEAADVGACEQPVAIERAGQSKRVELGLAAGGSIEASVVDAGGQFVPLANVALYGPACTRRDGKTNTRGELVFDALPAGRYTVRAAVPGPVGASPRSGMQVVVEDGGTTRCRVATELRCRLTVESRGAEVALYAVAAPPIAVDTDERGARTRARFATDDVGPHVVVARERRAPGRESVHFRAIDLAHGDATLALDLPETVAVLEVVGAGRALDTDKVWFRSERVGGAWSFHRVRSGRVVDAGTGKSIKAGLVADVPAGRGDLVFVELDGDVRVLADGIVLEKDETRRVTIAE